MEKKEERSGLFLFSCEEDWGRKGLISSPHRISDRSRLAEIGAEVVVVVVKREEEGGDGGFLEGHSRLCVGY